MPLPRRQTLDVDLAAARDILRRLDIPEAPAAIGRLPGDSTEVYRIDLAGEAAPLVLKLYPDEPDWRPGKERLVAGWFEDAPAIPTPRWLGWDLSRERLPLRFAVMTTLPGTPIRAWMQTPDAPDLYRQMGALLRQVHAIPAPAYGYVKDSGIERPAASNPEHMAQAFESAFRRFRDAGGDLELGRRLEALAAANLDLTVSTGPVLCHDDMHPGNVLARRDADGRACVCGLIDFGDARAADPLFDLAKAIFCSSHEDRRAGPLLLEGYGEPDHPDPAGALWLYTLHHRVTMWAWLTKLGQDPAAPDGPAGLIRGLHAMALEGGPPRASPDAWMT